MSGIALVETAESDMAQEPEKYTHVYGDERQAKLVRMHPVRELSTYRRLR